MVVALSVALRRLRRHTLARQLRHRLALVPGSAFRAGLPQRRCCWRTALFVAGAGIAFGILTETCGWRLAAPPASRRCSSIVEAACASTFRDSCRDCSSRAPSSCRSSSALSTVGSLDDDADGAPRRPGRQRRTRCSGATSASTCSRSPPSPRCSVSLVVLTVLSLVATAVDLRAPRRTRASSAEGVGRRRAPAATLAHSLALLFILFGVRLWIVGSSGLLYSTTGPLVGASYTDVHVRLPGDPAVGHRLRARRRTGDLRRRPPASWSGTRSSRPCCTPAVGTRLSRARARGGAEVRRRAERAGARAAVHRRGTSRPRGAPGGSTASRRARSRATCS